MPKRPGVHLSPSEADLPNPLAGPERKPINPAPKKGRPRALDTFGINEALVPKERLALYRRSYRYSRFRIAELGYLTGGEMSAGASAMVQNAGMAMFAGRTIYEDACSCEDPVERAKMFKMALGCFDTAKSHELAAFDVQMREARARRVQAETSGNQANELAQALTVAGQVLEEEAAEGLFEDAEAEGSSVRELPDRNP